MWQEPRGGLRAEEHDLEELDRDDREVHPQDLDDGEADFEDEDEFLD